jgi:hypothetical protein
MDNNFIKILHFNMKEQKNKEIIICNRTLLLIITNVNYVLHYKFYHP